MEFMSKALYEITKGCLALRWRFSNNNPPAMLVELKNL